MAPALFERNVTIHTGRLVRRSIGGQRRGPMLDGLAKEDTPTRRTHLVPLHPSYLSSCDAGPPGTGVPSVPDLARKGKSGAKLSGQGEPAEIRRRKLAAPRKDQDLRTGTRGADEDVGSPCLPSRLERLAEDSVRCGAYPASSKHTTPVVGPD